MSFRVDGSAVNKGDGHHGAVGLFLLKRSGKPIDAGVAVHPKRAGAVLHGVPAQQDQGRWSGELREHVTHDGSRDRRQQNCGTLLEESSDWSNPFGHISQELLLVRKATQERVQIAGHGHESQSRQYICVWAHARWRGGATQEIGVSRAETGFQGRELEIVLA